VTISPPVDVAVEVFLAGADSVLAAVSSPEVGAAWEAPSVLEDQAVGGLAGHLARGGVWVVGDYLSAGPADGAPVGPPAVAHAGEYFARVADEMTAEGHQAIRDRGAGLAARGQDWLVGELRHRLAGLPDQLSALPDDALVAAYAGQVMRLGDYLVTRIVEQVVHPDDLSRSVDGAPWPVPPAAVDLALAVGVAVGR
jgi:hypothetical protein